MAARQLLELGTLPIRIVVSPTESPTSTPPVSPPGTPPRTPRQYAGSEPVIKKARKLEPQDLYELGEAVVKLLERRDLDKLIRVAEEVKVTRTKERELKAATNVVKELFSVHIKAPAKKKLKELSERDRKYAFVRKFEPTAVRMVRLSELTSLISYYFQEVEITINTTKVTMESGMEEPTKITKVLLEGTQVYYNCVSLGYY
jgi:hypothetical protein